MKPTWVRAKKCEREQEEKEVGRGHQGASTVKRRSPCFQSGEKGKELGSVKGGGDKKDHRKEDNKKWGKRAGRDKCILKEETRINAKVKGTEKRH